MKPVKIQFNNQFKKDQKDCGMVAIDLLPSLRILSLKSHEMRSIEIGWLMWSVHVWWTSKLK